MDIMGLVTRKLKAQNLDGTRKLTESLQISHNQAAGDFDSGTASDDDEIIERGESLTEINKCDYRMDEMLSEEVRYFSSLGKSMATSFDNGNETTTTRNAFIFSALPSTGSSIFRRVVSGNGGRLSAVSSDFERCSLDFDSSSSSSLEMDRRSSSSDDDEELSVINRDDKRKRSTDPSSDDADDVAFDEPNERRLFHDCDRPLSGRRLVLGNRIPVSAFSGPPGRTVFSASPRKCHRRSTNDVDSVAVAAASAAQRPSLDLYKMQKTSFLIRRQSCSSCRPRIVKIRTINGSLQSTKSNFDPSSFLFRSISWTPHKDLRKTVQ